MVQCSKYVKSIKGETKRLNPMIFGTLRALIVCGQGKLSPTATVPLIDNKQARERCDAVYTYAVATPGITELSGSRQLGTGAGC